MKWYLLQIVFGSMLIVAWVMSDPVLLPTAMIRYMVVVLARPIFGSHCLVEEQLLQIKFDWPVRLEMTYVC